LGVVIDGCPAGVKWNQQLIEHNLKRRRPGSSDAVSGRQESDEFEVLSGVFEGVTLGTPIALVVRNEDARSQDYNTIKTQPRAGHADDVWKNKFGHSDHRGGGRSSGRETVSRVLAGSVAQMLAQQIAPSIRIDVKITEVGGQPYSEKTQEKLQAAKAQGESFGGILEVNILGAPANLGQPIFHKLKSDFTAAFMSVGAVTAVELGKGLESTQEKGTDFHESSDSSQYGGIRGGISTGETIRFRVHVKPTSSILDVAKKGRHDPFIGIRAVPVLESMAYLVLADHLLWVKTDRI
jgi:chorismate synthase